MAGGMVTVVLRVYGELHRHLASGRGRRFEQTIDAGCGVGEMLAGLGVPAAAVDLVLVNGQSVDFHQPLADGDRVSVYPAFEALDIGPVSRLPGRPLRSVRFVADVHLGRLAYYLRLLGFDARYETDAADAELLAVSRRQVAEMLARFDLYRLAAPLTRCLVCTRRCARSRRRRPRSASWMTSAAVTAPSRSVRGAGGSTGGGRTTGNLRRVAGELLAPLGAPQCGQDAAGNDYSRRP